MTRKTLQSTVVDPPSPEAGPRVVLYVDSRFFVKDPNSSELGQRIVESGILMLESDGYESFTFRKLAEKLGTTEPSIYRYFRSKHRFLLYLTSWYWNWMEYRLRVATSSVTDPADRLRRALMELTQPIVKDDSMPRIDEEALYRVVVAESTKVYLHSEVDAENREGLYLDYKRLCRTVAEMVLAVEPDYQWPIALVSTVMETSHLQKFFAEHLPRLTDVSHDEVDRSTTEFLIDLVFRTIAPRASTACR